MATSAPSIFPALAQLDIGDVLAHMPGGFFVYHADGDEAVVYVNEACLRIFGCADEEQFVALTGGTFPGMVHPEDIEAVEHSISPSDSGRPVLHGLRGVPASSAATARCVG